MIKKTICIILLAAATMMNSGCGLVGTLILWQNHKNEEAKRQKKLDEEMAKIKEQDEEDDKAFREFLEDQKRTKKENEEMRQLLKEMREEKKNKDTK